MFSPCGTNCETCYDYRTNCPGCRKAEGKVYWAPYTGLDVCPIYHCCAMKSGYANCGQCSKLPCQLYYDTRDPSVSQEAHEADILLRVSHLKSRKEEAK